VLTVRDEDAPSPSTEEMPSKEVKVSLSKISGALERDASEETFSEEKGQKSETGNVKTRMIFVNRSKQPVKVYWLDYRGQRVFYKKLKPSESYTQDTYMTHPWLITDLHDNAWDVYMPTVRPRTVIVTVPKKR
jgi:von Hippel-Lindau disease tumor supressor